MGFLSFLKGMKIEDHCPIDLTFRTSKTCGFLGTLLVSTSLILGIQILFKNPLFCYFNLVWCCSILLALTLLVVGVLVATYRKCVIISKVHSRIEFMESSLCSWRRATYHFNEIESIELCRVHECLFSSRCEFWTVKVYVRRHDQFEAVRLYEGIKGESAEEAATHLSQILGKPVYEPEPSRFSGAFEDQVAIS